jgi:DNA repair protein RecN (Recombination protein N)
VASDGENEGVLASLAIEGLALVESIELEFAPGLNVLTGETGAGKSLVLGSIGLLLGERADAAWLRAGAVKGWVEGTLDLATRPDLVQALATRDVESEEGRVALRREVLADGKSRAFVNGRSVLVSQLKEVGDLLVDLHGQHEHQLLLRTERQADFFDGWAGLLAERHALEEERAALAEERRKLRETRERWERDRAEESAVREDWEELAAARIVSDEEERLRGERERILHRDRILSGLAAARGFLAEEDAGAADQTARAARAVRGILAQEPDAESLLSELEGVLGTIGEIASRIERIQDRLAAEPVDTETVEARLDVIHRLKRKHRTDAPGLLALLDALEARVRAFDPSGASLEAAEEAHEARLQAYERRLDAFLSHRTDRIAAFEREAGSRLARLGFGKGSLRVQAAEPDRARAAVDPTSIPTLEFAFQPNPGEAPKPLRRIASGGELSRVMLAIKSIMADRDEVSVLVFDEVDQGIGGAVAEEVGLLLRALSGERQVLCITHLPLIAAYGERHFNVSKTTRAGRTVTAVRTLDAHERVDEVARLLAGDRVSETTRRQARELLAGARDGSREVAAPRRKAVRSAR